MMDKIKNMQGIPIFTLKLFFFKIGKEYNIIESNPVASQLHV